MFASINYNINRKMKNLPLLKKVIQKTTSFNLNKQSFRVNYILVLLCCLLINKSSIAQSYSLSTTGAIPDSSAALDIISSNKGLLIPRVSLLSTTDSSTITHPSISLQVYNTNASMTGGGKGFWYWDGTKWIRSISSVGADSLVVGTSTSSHLYNLQVTGTIGATTSLTTPAIIGGSGTTSALTYKTTTGVGASGADHIFKVGNNGGTEAMRVLNNGNVGIGTTTPTSKLDVNGVIVSYGPNGIRFRNSANTVTNGYVYHNDIDLFELGNVLNGSFGIVTNNIRRVTILGGGNVGIGTTSPSAKLHSLGNTEQLRLGYDASNYYSTTVGSSGAVTFDATGSGAAFIFSDAVSLANNSTASTQSLNDSTTKVATTAFVDRALAGVSGGSGWGLTGNSGTTDGTHFIGTTDNKPFNIKVNNQKAGRVDNSQSNAFWGYQAGNANTSGYGNTAVGDQALKSTTTGTSNTAIGSQALYTNTTGSYNTATGEVALNHNTTGAYNTAIGEQSMYYNTTGNSNTGIGMQALAVNTTGGYNAAVGYAALGYNTTGDFNTAVGFGAASTNTTGYYNTFLGYATDVNANNLNNSTAIGYAAMATASNYIKIGNSSVSTIAGQVSWTTLSDSRFKINVNENDIKGLDFIMQLRPVAYNVDTRKYEEFLTKNMPDSIRTKRLNGQDFAQSTAKRHNGFLAQEIEQAVKASGYEFSGLHKPETDDDNYGLAYSEFVVPLVKAVQEQQELIKTQQTSIEQLTKRIQQLESNKRE